MKGGILAAICGACENAEAEVVSELPLGAESCDRRETSDLLVTTHREDHRWVFSLGIPQ